MWSKRQIRKRQLPFWTWMKKAKDEDEEITHSNKEGGEKIGFIEPPTYKQTAVPREESLMGELYPKEYFEHKKNGQKQLTGRKPIRFRWLLRN
jgi:hypothetical protein